ncbi:acyltransferase family protein [Psychrobium sp. nBUS_13]|uniref:acyltransferase family protein n=1 Tax=Psychrobium sp. nBUS_13 TaxID=3395319 RepID=UPI003EC0F21E
MNLETQDIMNIFFCITTLIFIAIFSKFIFLRLNISKWIPLPKRKSNIDGLRGYLAILVIFHHFSLTYYWLVLGEWKAPSELYFQNFGKVGVGIFFIITGYLFIGKLIRNKFDISIKELMISRCFRIMPLYFFAFVFIFLIVMLNTNFHFVVSVKEFFISILRWFLFHGSKINQFEDTRRIIAGVDWTLKYEWFFYFSVPVIAFFFKINKVVSVSVVTAFVVYLFIFPIKLMAFTSIYFILFLIGGWIYYFEFSVKNIILDNLFYNIIAIGLLFFAIFISNPFSILQILSIALFFTLVVQGVSMFGLLKTEFSIFLGEISYGIYLLHGFILFGLYQFLLIYSMNNISLTHYFYFLPLISFIVILIASLTYIYIEKPSMEYGKELRMKIN